MTQQLDIAQYPPEMLAAGKRLDAALQDYVDPEGTGRGTIDGYMVIATSRHHGGCGAFTFFGRGQNAMSREVALAQLEGAAQSYWPSAFIAFTHGEE